MKGLRCKCRANKDADEIVEPVLKYVLVSFNLLALIISIGFIIAGSWLIYQFNSILGNNANFTSALNLSIDLGVYLIITGIVGVFFTSVAIAGTYRENIFALRLYMFVLLLIMTINLVIGVIFLIFSGKITNVITNNLQNKYITQYFEDDEIKTVFDTLQSQYDCCGIKDYTDWSSNVYYNCSATNSAVKCMVPPSCCVGYSSSATINLMCSGNVLNDNTKLSNIYTGGCSNAIVSLADYGIKLMSGILIGLTIILAINIALVQYLIILIQKEMALYNAKYRIQDSNELLDDAYFN